MFSHVNILRHHKWSVVVSIVRDESYFIQFSVLLPTYIFFILCLKMSTNSNRDWERVPKWYIEILFIELALANDK